MTRKTSTSRSRTTSSKNSTGKKVQKSSGKSKVTPSSSKTQKNLEKNLQTLSSSPKEQKKTGKTSGTTAKAKAKSTKKPSVKSSTPQKRKDPGIKYTRSKDMKLFPFVGTFPWRLEDRKEKKTCWFQCFDHAEKYILRYQLTKLQYKLQEAVV